MDWLAVLQTTKGVMLLILGIGLIIFVHELGHFLVAKFVGIKVDQFAIGFGHALLAWRRGIGFRLGSTEAERLRRLVKQLEGSERDQVQFPDRTGLNRFSNEAVARAEKTLGLGETE